MADIRNDSLLEEFITYAKSLGGGQSLTIDKYVLSVVETVYGKNDKINLDSGKRETLDLMICRYLPVSELGIEAVTDKIKDRVKTKNSYMDTLNLSKYLYMAKEKAKKDGLEALPPEILLECILGSQNELTGAFGEEKTEEEERQTEENAPEEQEKKEERDNE